MSLTIHIQTGSGGSLALRTENAMEKKQRSWKTGWEISLHVESSSMIKCWLCTTAVGIDSKVINNSDSSVFLMCMPSQGRTNRSWWDPTEKRPTVSVGHPDYNATTEFSNWNGVSILKRLSFRETGIKVVMYLNKKCSSVGVTYNCEIYFLNWPAFELITTT